jgi:hypothetical protein
MTSRKRAFYEKVASGYYRDEEGRTRPITSKNVGAALARGIVIKRVVDEEGKVVEKPTPQPKLKPSTKPQRLAVPEREGTWVAKITGSDPQYHFARTFLDFYEKEGLNRVYKLGDGIYELNRYSAVDLKFKRHFIVVENDTVKSIPKAEVERMFPRGGVGSDSDTTIRQRRR